MLYYSLSGKHLFSTSVRKNTWFLFYVARRTIIQLAYLCSFKQKQSYFYFTVDACCLDMKLNNEFSSNSTQHIIVDVNDVSSVSDEKKKTFTH